MCYNLFKIGVLEVWLYEGLEVTNTVNLYEYPIDGSKVVGKVTSKDSIKTSYSYGVWLVWYYAEVKVG